MSLFMHASLFMLVCFCLMSCATFRPALWLLILAAVPFYLRLFSKLVHFNVQPLLCPNSWNASAAMWTPHSAKHHLFFPLLCALLWWTEAPSQWNVCHNKHISHRLGNSFGRPCVCIIGRQRETHWVVICAILARFRLAKSARKSFQPSFLLLLLTELIHKNLAAYF